MKTVVRYKAAPSLLSAYRISGRLLISFKGEQHMKNRKQTQGVEVLFTPPPKARLSEMAPITRHFPNALLQNVLSGLVSYSCVEM
jgi:hypothetical protein